MNPAMQVQVFVLLQNVLLSEVTGMAYHNYEREHSKLLEICNNICAEYLPEEIESPDPECKGCLADYTYNSALEELNACLLFRYDSQEKKLYLEICDEENLSDTGYGEVFMSESVSGRDMFNVLKVTKLAEDMMDKFEHDREYEMDCRKIFEENNNFYFPDTIFREITYMEDGSNHTEKQMYKIIGEPYIPPYGELEYAYGEYEICSAAIDVDSFSLSNFSEVDPEDFGSESRITVYSDSCVYYSYNRVDFYSGKDESVDVYIGKLQDDKVMDVTY